MTSWRSLWQTVLLFQLSHSVLQFYSCVVQVDILSNDGEVQQVTDFVADNAQRLLNVDAAKVIPISSRLALEAKEAATTQGTAPLRLNSFQLAV